MARIWKRLWIVELFFQNYLSWLARSFSWPRGGKKCWSIELFSIVRNSWYVSIVYIYIHMYKSFEQFQKPQLVTIIRDYITTHYVGADHNPWTKRWRRLWSDRALSCFSEVVLEVQSTIPCKTQDFIHEPCSIDVKKWFKNIGGAPQD